MLAFMGGFPLQRPEKTRCSKRLDSLFNIVSNLIRHLQILKIRLYSGLNEKE